MNECFSQGRLTAVRSQSWERGRVAGTATVQGTMSRPPGSRVTHSSLLSARGRGSRFPPAGSAGASGGWAGSHNALGCRGTSGCLRTQETNKSNQSENTVLSSLETMKAGGGGGTGSLDCG